MIDSIKIGILSDSHKKVTLTSQAIDYLKSKDARYLIHAGDLEVEENLQLLNEYQIAMDKASIVSKIDTKGLLGSFTI